MGTGPFAAAGAPDGTGAAFFAAHCLVSGATGVQNKFEEVAGEFEEAHSELEVLSELKVLEEVHSELRNEFGGVLDKPEPAISVVEQVAAMVEPIVEFEIKPLVELLAEIVLVAIGVELAISRELGRCTTTEP